MNIAIYDSKEPVDVGCHNRQPLWRLYHKLNICATLALVDDPFAPTRENKAYNDAS